MGIGIALTILGCCIKRRTSSGTGSDVDPVRDGIERAGDRNRELEDAERATSERLREQAETIERTGSDNQDAQQLVQKAKHILHSAKHTD
jgi:hypothetical protein